jgi:hypothetical protein
MSFCTPPVAQVLGIEKTTAETSPSMRAGSLVEVVARSAAGPFWQGTEIALAGAVNRVMLLRWQDSSR